MSTGPAATTLRGSLLEAFARQAPARLGQELLQAPADEASRVLSALEPESAARVLATMPPGAAAPTLHAMPEAAAAAVATRLELQVLVNLLRHLGREPERAVLSMLPAATRGPVSRLLSHPTDRVGAHMEPRVASLLAELPASRALEALAAQQASSDAIFVVAEDQKLLGWVRWRRLLGAAEGEPLSTLVDPESASLSMDARVQDALDDPAWNRRSMLPVVDAKGRLVGAVSHGALRHAAGQSANRRTGPDPGRTARELGGLYALGISSLWELAAGAARRSSAHDRERQP